jgi:hypothetical protein
MSFTSPVLRLPYAHLNLRRNPFGELSFEDWTRVAAVDVDRVVASLKNPNYVVQFVGEKGYGKTTHLLAIRSHFATAGYVHIPEGETAEIPSGCPVLIDEAQRLTTWQRFRLFRQAVPLVLGTHRDFSVELRRAGRSVETVAVEQGTTATLLYDLLNRRIEHARRGDGPVPSVTVDTTAMLLERCGPNIRRILHELYAVFQNLTHVCDL